MRMITQGILTDISSNISSINREFVLAGRAIFTVSNASGEWYTFRIKKAFQNTWYAEALSGPDNGRNYLKVCRISEDGTCSKVSDEHRSKILQWAIRRIWLQDSLPDGYSIRHAGKCGRCGRLLTTPDSIEIGLGPECRKRTA